jgi:hypothetical protein
VQFILYTEYSIKQCTTALTERMEVRGTKARPEIDGWIEKGGKFSLATTSQVIAKFSRTTRLRATATREGNHTVISGYVPTGIPRERIVLVMVALLVVAVILYINGNGLLGIVAGALSAAMYVPLVGDYNNREYLLKELKKALHAKETPPESK